MEQRAVEREKRKRDYEARKKVKRQRTVQRVVMIGVGVVLVGVGMKLTLGSWWQGEAAKEVIRGAEESSSASGMVQVTREDLAKGDLVLVNETYPLRNYDESSMVVLAEGNEGFYQIKSKTLKLNQEVVLALNEMLQAFKEVNGASELIVISGYRDFYEQEKIHYETILNKGQEYAEAYVAKPDRSEHHTGLAVDFGIYKSNGSSETYDGTGIYSWINENAHRYGFVLRYEEEKKDITGISDEPWHFRYVGRPHATLMKELELCLEEYVTYLKTYTYYTNPGHGLTDASKQYSIYYVPVENEITNLPVPASKPYTISGNNIDGFIVTVDLTAN